MALADSGYRVYHDVPAEAGGARFKIDHVVLGPRGVFAIETKTRRKGRARSGYEAHKVGYDGEQLIWPWGEDESCLAKTRDRARWLGGCLNRMTGLGLSPVPVLVLPGWYVVLKGLGDVIVVNHKQLPGAILRQPGAGQTAEQISLIARQLDARCRDVKD